VARRARNRTEMDRQADRRKVAFKPLGLRLRQQPALGREAECECHAEPNSLTVQQPIRKAGRGLKCMAESMAEIEQCTLPTLSRPSRATIAAVIRQLTAIACSRAAPPAKISRQFDSSQAKKSASPISPYLTISA